MSLSPALPARTPRARPTVLYRPHARHSLPARVIAQIDLHALLHQQPVRVGVEGLVADLRAEQGLVGLRDGKVVRLLAGSRAGGARIGPGEVTAEGAVLAFQGRFGGVFEVAAARGGARNEGCEVGSELIGES